jgi:hypothetical protein
MSLSIQKIAFLLSIQSVFFSIFVNSQLSLTAVELQNKFPEGPNYAVTPFYNQDFHPELIYLFGGVRDGNPSNIVSILNVSSQNPVIETIGSFPNTADYGGMELIGNELYFVNGDSGTASKIYKVEKDDR